MATILIAEPSEALRGLFAAVIAHLGHHAVDARGLGAEDLAEVDVLVLEPGESWALELAERLRRARPDLPIICVSIHPPTPLSRALDPVAFVQKPFALADLEEALTRAVERD